MARALVIGGGIAGPVAAMALQKVGFEPTIYEAFDRAADGVGAFVNLAPNGLNALENLGLAELVTRKGFDTPEIAFYKHTGKPLTGPISIGRHSGDGAVIRTLRRPELYAELRNEAIRRGIRIEYGKRLVDAVPTADGVRAVFADEQTAEGDILIGADGLHSQVRSVIDPASPAPRFLGVLNVFGSAEGLRVEGKPGPLHMFFGRKGFFMYIKTPSGDVWWFANPAVPDEARAERLRRLPAESRREWLLEGFGGDKMPAARIVAASTDLPAPTLAYDVPKVPRWHRDRMIIIGDAAHAVSQTAGQGAAVAMEDAIVLAKCLRDAPTVEAAFDAYESLRRERAEAIVALGKHNKEGNTAGPLGRVIRDFFIKRAFREGSKNNPVWPHTHRIHWDTPVVIGDARSGVRTAS